MSTHADLDGSLLVQLGGGRLELKLEGGRRRRLDRLGLTVGGKDQVADGQQGQCHDDAYEPGGRIGLGPILVIALAHSFLHG